MTNTQGANSKGETEPRDPENLAENNISSTSDTDVLGDSALEDVSGGAWPSATTKTGIVPPTI
jgi:hypothetical protein